MIDQKAKRRAKLATRRIKDGKGQMPVNPSEVPKDHNLPAHMLGKAEKVHEYAY